MVSGGSHVGAFQRSSMIVCEGNYGNKVEDHCLSLEGAGLTRKLMQSGRAVEVASTVLGQRE